MLPTFLIIGAMKAGTTSLYDYLDAHPDIYVSPKKELDFFIAERRWHNGIDWYRRCFEAAAVDIRGEASPNYSKAHLFRGVPERIAQVVPDVKLVYLVRDPIERMRSMYLHRVSEGAERRPLERAFRENEDYLETSCYASQLKAYLSCFPRERLLVVASEDLREQRGPTLERVLDFLGADTEWEPPNLAAESHRTADKRARYRAASAVRGWAPYRTLARHAPTSVKRVHYRMTTRPVSPDEAIIPASLEAELRDRLRPEVDELRDLVGGRFERWGFD